MKKKLQFIKKCPFFLLLVSSGILLSLIGLGGRSGVYAGQEYDPLKAPASALMFTALKDEIYPWQVFMQEPAQVMAGVDETTDGDAGPAADRDSAEEGQSEGDGEEAGSGQGENNSRGQSSSGTEGKAVSKASAAPGGEGEDPKEDESEAGKEAESEGSDKDGDETGDLSGSEGTSDPEEPGGQSGEGEGTSSAGTEIPEGRLQPLRESTREEYLNHISADIYGDAGVRRAAEYEFAAVDESYFEDALFIGDSRTVGLRNYTSLSEHADFYCETSLTIYKVLEEDFGGKGTVKEALEKNDYGKIYIMVGINELGTGTTEDFMREYTSVIDTLHELEPDALIFIQGIMRVTGKKHNSDAIYNNNNINARNNAIATLADNEQFFYIDVNEVVCDEEGNLNTEYTFDQLHLLGVYDDLWKEFLLSHGVIREGAQGGSQGSARAVSMHHDIRKKN